MSNDLNHAHSEQEHAVGSVKVYILGFVVSLVLTVIPFCMVAKQSISSSAITAWIFIFGTIQLLIQLLCFMHMASEPKPRWNFWSLVYAIIMVVCIVGGTIWIMWSLQINLHSM